MRQTSHADRQITCRRDVAAAAGVVAVIAGFVPNRARLGYGVGYGTCCDHDPHLLLIYSAGAIRCGACMRERIFALWTSVIFLELLKMRKALVPVAWA